MKLHEALDQALEDVRDSGKPAFIVADKPDRTHPPGFKGYLVSADRPVGQVYVAVWAQNGEIVTEMRCGQCGKKNVTGTVTEVQKTIKVTEERRMD